MTWLCVWETLTSSLPFWSRALQSSINSSAFCLLNSNWKLIWWHTVPLKLSSYASFSELKCPFFRFRYLPRF